MPISFETLLALLPLLVLASGSVAVLLAAAFASVSRLAFFLHLATLALTAAVLPMAGGPEPIALTPLLVMDGYGRFFIGLFVAMGGAVALLGDAYLRVRGEEGHRGEFHLLLLLATVGAGVLAMSRHFASLFLGLEILTAALYPLIGYRSGEERCIEAVIKYLLPAGVSSSFLLFGIALLYLQAGSLSFAGLPPLLATQLSSQPIVAGGLAMVVAGLGFKLALAPFHLWAADVYQGAPAPVSAFLSTVSKAAVFALLLRLFAETGAYTYASLSMVLALIAIATMLVGNLLALMQEDLKRLLAYSSIAHLGYLLVALLASEHLGTEAVLFYLVAYSIANVGAFAVVNQLSLSPEGHEVSAMARYRGLFWQRPLLGGALTLMLLSLAGMPLTVGFIGKFYLFAAGVSSALWALVLTMAAGSALGLFYYLRWVGALFAAPSPLLQTRRPAAAAHWGGAAVLAALSLLLLGLGFYPAAFMGLLQGAMLGL